MGCMVGEKNRNWRRSLSRGEGMLKVGKTMGGANWVGEMECVVSDVLCYIGHAAGKAHSPAENAGLICRMRLSSLEVSKQGWSEALEIS